jgi:hypothetical protein
MAAGTTQDYDLPCGLFESHTPANPVPHAAGGCYDYFFRQIPSSATRSASADTNQNGAGR